MDVSTDPVASRMKITDNEVAFSLGTTYNAVEAVGVVEKVVGASVTIKRCLSACEAAVDEILAKIDQRYAENLCTAPEYDSNLRKVMLEMADRPLQI